MAWPRFYVERLPASGVLELDENESRHASGVLRMSVGNDCLAFDGCGGEAHCSVTKVSKRSVELQIVERLDTNRELPKPITLAVALPKGDRQKTLVDFLVQLGVHSFQPLVTERGVAQPVDAALARLRRSVIESSKQCGRNHLMNVLEPVDLGHLIDLSQPTPGLRFFAHPYGEVAPLNQLQSSAQSAEAVTALIGPEGGFTEEEAESLRAAGWFATSLGPRILRVEVAATHVASYLSGVCFQLAILFLLHSASC